MKISFVLFILHSKNAFSKQAVSRSWIIFTPKKKKKLREREWGKDKSQTLRTLRNTAFLSTPLRGFPNTLSNRAKSKPPMSPRTPITALRRRPRRRRNPRRSPVTTCCSPAAAEQATAVSPMLWLLRTSMSRRILSLINRYAIYSFCCLHDSGIVRDLISWRNFRDSETRGIGSGFD